MRLKIKRDKTIVFLRSPLPVADSVRKALRVCPQAEYWVLGGGITPGYLRDCGLEGARILGGVPGWKSRLALLKTFRKEYFQTAIYIGQSSDLIGLGTIALSGARQRLFYQDLKFSPRIRKVHLCSLLFRAVYCLGLFILSWPLLLIQRLILPKGEKPPGLLSNSSLSLPWKDDELTHLSIVIPNYNGKNLLAKCLPSLKKALAACENRSEIIVVDDASRDGSAEWIRQNFPSVRLVILKENQGFARASNLGVESARHRLVILLNSDIVVEKDFLFFLIPHFRDPDVFAVQPRMNEWEEENLNRGLSVGHLENGYIRIWNEKEALNEKYLDFPALNLYAIGGAMAFDKAKWDILGGFDDLYYPFCWEDIDISYRAWKRGWKVFYEPRSKVYHLHHGTISRFFTAEYKRIIEQKNELLFIWKNIHSPFLFRSHLNNLPRLILFALLKGNMAFYKAFWKASQNFLSVRKIRRSEISLSRISDEEVFQKSLLPYQNWVKRGFREKERDEKPQILMINTVIPYPPTDGGKIRVYQMLKHLSRHYDIHLVAFYRNPKELENLEGIRSFCRRAEAVPLKWMGMNPLKKALFPHFSRGYASQEMLAKIQEILKTRPIDLVQFDSTLMAYYRKVIEDVPTILVELDAGVLKLGRSYNPSFRGLGKIVEFYEWLRTLKFELELFPRFNMVITLSDQDEKLLKSFLPGLNVRTVTQGTDLDHFCHPYRELKNPKIVYVGSWRFYPNEDAIRWFISSIFPLIRKKVPGAGIEILGTGDPSRIADLGNLPGVHFIGEVDNVDVVPYLSAASVFVAPSRLGMGMKGKVLEALAMAKPVVATSVAVSGIPVESGEHLLIADQAEEFAGAVLELFSNPSLRKKIALRGQSLVQKQFDWKQKAEEMAGIYQEVIDSSYW